MEDLKKQKENIETTISSFREEIPVLESRKKDSEKQRSELLAKMALAKEGEKSLLKNEISKLDEELLSIGKEITTITDSITGLEVKLEEIKKDIRIFAKLTKEAEYLDAHKRLSSLPAEIEEQLGKIKEPTKKLLALAEEAFRLKIRYGEFLEEFSSFITVEGVDISERIGKAKLEKDQEEFALFKKKILVLAGEVVSFDVLESNFRRIAALLN